MCSYENAINLHILFLRNPHIFCGFGIWQISFWRVLKGKRYETNTFFILLFLNTAVPYNYNLQSLKLMQWLMPGSIIPVNKCMLKVNNRNTRERCEIRSKL